MRTVEVAPRQWGRRLDEFSASNEGLLVSVEALAPTLGAQPQIRDLPLVGISADEDSRGPAMSIAAMRSDGEHVTHIIHAPTALRIEQTDEGEDVAVEIESAEGTTTIVRVNASAPLAPDTPRTLRKQ